MADSSLISKVDVRISSRKFLNWSFRDKNVDSKDKTCVYVTCDKDEYGRLWYADTDVTKEWADFMLVGSFDKANFSDAPDAPKLSDDHKKALLRVVRHEQSKLMARLGGGPPSAAGIWTDARGKRQKITARKGMCREFRTLEKGEHFSEKGMTQFMNLTQVITNQSSQISELRVELQARPEAVAAAAAPDPWVEVLVSFKAEVLAMFKNTIKDKVSRFTLLPSSM